MTDQHWRIVIVAAVIGLASAHPKSRRILLLFSKVSIVGFVIYMFVSPFWPIF